MESLAFLDEIKKLVIIAMFSDDDLMERLVLKGGNLLDIVYRVSTRASIDVDFSIEDEFDDLERFGQRIVTALTQTFAEAGYVAFDIHIREVPSPLSADLRGFWGGYRVEFKILERARYDQLKDDIEALRKQAAGVGKRGSTKFNVQISKHEYCRPKQPRQLEGYTVYVYSPEMTVAEKLRAICQQMPEYAAMVKSHPSARARDFVDIFTTLEHFAIDFRDEAFQRIVRETFAVKRVPLNLIGEIKGFREYHRQDFAAVEATVKPGLRLKGYEFYFNYVVDKCRHLETLWNE